MITVSFLLHRRILDQLYIQYPQRPTGNPEEEGNDRRPGPDHPKVRDAMHHSR